MNARPAMTVSLRPLVAGDMAMLHRWHNAPHLRPHYMQADISAEEIARKFTPRLASSHTVRCRVALADGVPFGFAQWYPSLHWPDCGAVRAGLTDGCSADYFIGDANSLGLGLAARMLVAVVTEVFAEMPRDQRILCIAHDARNARAIRATLAAGFCAQATVTGDSATTTVYVRRAASGDSISHA